MQPAIFATTFARPSLEETLDAAVAAGFAAVQFDLCLAGGVSMPGEVDPALAREVHDALASRGMTMAAVEGTYNMAHPDGAVRADGAERLAGLIAAAPALGTHVVSLCTGSRDPDSMWRRHPDSATPEAWSDMRASVAAALDVAEAHGVTLGVEPEYSNVVSSAAAARRLLDELGSPNLRIVLDAANLIPPGELGRQAAILAEGFELLGGDIALAHGKDVLDDGTFVAAGRGGLDYPAVVRHLSAAGYDGPFVLHSLGEAEVPAALSLLRGELDAVAG